MQFGAQCFTVFLLITLHFLTLLSLPFLWWRWLRIDYFLSHTYMLSWRDLCVHPDWCCLYLLLLVSTLDVLFLFISFNCEIILFFSWALFHPKLFSTSLVQCVNNVFLILITTSRDIFSYSAEYFTSWVDECPE